MPIYVFSCNGCGNEFDSLMKPYDPVQCPHCRCNDCEKRVTAPSGYKIKGDNGASTSPKAFDHAEQDRRDAKRERVSKIYEKQGIKI